MESGTKTTGGSDPIELVNIESLPIRLQAIAVTLGWMHSEGGFSKAEIARFYGKSRPWVSARLRELEDGLRAQIASTSS